MSSSTHSTNQGSTLTAVPHGTITGYTTYHCRCLACTNAWRDYMREYARHSRAGEPRTVPASETRAYVQTLIDGGLTQHAIAAACGVSQQCITNLLSGRTRRVTHRVTHALMGVEIGEATPGHNVPVWKAERIIEALTGSGFSEADIARMLGCKSGKLQIGRGPRVFWRSYHRLATLYRLLAMRGLVPAALVGEL